MYLHFVRAALSASPQRPGASAGVRRGSAGGERCSVPCCAPWRERVCFSPFSSCRRNPGGRLGKESWSLLERRGGGSSFIHHPLGRSVLAYPLTHLSHGLFLCLLTQREYFLPGPCVSWMRHWKLHLGWSPLHQVYASHLVSFTLLCVPAMPCRFALHSLEIPITYHKDNIPCKMPIIWCSTHLA